jgi:CBS-domain-containing membrane protein
VQVYDALTAECIMSPNVVRVRQEPSIAEIQECLATTHNAFPVRNSDDRFAGMVTRAQLEEALDQGGSVDITLSTRMDHSPFIVQRTVSLRRVLRLFRGMGLRHIPVVDINGGNRQVIGMISRKDFLDTPNSLSEGLLDSKFEKVTRAFMKDMEGFRTYRLVTQTLITRTANTLAHRERGAQEEAWRRQG